MGIKICPQCGGKVSDARNDCPHCNYNFIALKKCPDCEEEIASSLSECPICGHIFEEYASKATTAPLQEQTEKDGNALTCPYCLSTEIMQTGDLCACLVCHNKFLDTRGLPASQPKKVEQPSSVAVSEVSTSTETTPTKTNNETTAICKARIINKLVLKIAIIIWIVGFMFMLGVKGEVYNEYARTAMAVNPYYSLLQLFSKDALSCLSVIFIIVFGIMLFVNFFVNKAQFKKWVLILVSSITLLFGAAAITLTSCLECGDICFFCHMYGGNLVTLIVMLGVSELCEIVSLVLCCTCKPQ